MTTKTETLEGYVVDIACIQKYPTDEMERRARAHTKDCTLTQHCIESDYGIINEQSSVTLLDPAATPLIVDAVKRSSRAQGIKLRVMRRLERDAMQTTQVEEI